MILGRLKPIEWFLSQGWVDDNDFITDEKNNTGVFTKMIGRELELKLVEPYLGLTLQDINDLTLYKEEWFEYLNDDVEDLDEYGYPYQTSPKRGVK